MNNYKILLQYDGSRYNGWQKQNDTSNTIQQILTDTISGLTKERIKLIGSGRTDAGVHALAQTANFRCRRDIDMQRFISEANDALPEDIRINSVEEVPEDFHSRYSAVGKVYVYRLDIGDVRNTFERKYSWRPEGIPDQKLMRQAAKYLVGEHDFRAFCTNSGEMPYTVKTVFSIDFNGGERGVKRQFARGILEIEYHGSGFLYNMVRILTGTLVDAGLGRFKPEDIADILAGGVRSAAGQLAPAKGLFLKEVRY